MQSTNPNAEVEYDLGVMIGRFQFPHRSHLDSIIASAERCRNFKLFCGSANKARTTDNPHTTEERAEMITLSLPKHLVDRVRIVGQDDLGHTPSWVASITDRTNAWADQIGASRESICLFGHVKDKSSFYLREFPHWTFQETGNTTGLSATPFRESYYRLRTGREAELWFDIVKDDLPTGTIDFLRNFIFTPDFDLIAHQFEPLI